MAASHGAQNADDGHSAMDMAAHRDTFSGFVKVTEWSAVILAMLVALLVFAFAMGLGWWTGVAVWTAIGVAAGVILRMGGAWWAALIGSTAALVVGGGLVAGAQLVVGLIAK